MSINGNDIADEIPTMVLIARKLTKMMSIALKCLFINCHALKMKSIYR